MDLEHSQTAETPIWHSQKPASRRLHTHTFPCTKITVSFHLLSDNYAHIHTSRSHYIPTGIFGAHISDKTRRPWLWPQRESAFAFAGPPQSPRVLRRHIYSLAPNVRLNFAPSATRTHTHTRARERERLKKEIRGETGRKSRRSRGKKKREHICSPMRACVCDVRRFGAAACARCIYKHPAAARSQCRRVIAALPSCLSFYPG